MPKYNETKAGKAKRGRLGQVQRIVESWMEADYQEEYRHLIEVNRVAALVWCAERHPRFTELPASRRSTLIYNHARARAHGALRKMYEVEYKDMRVKIRAQLDQGVDPETLMKRTYKPIRGRADDRRIALNKFIFEHTKLLFADTITKGYFMRVVAEKVQELA